MLVVTVDVGVDPARVEEFLVATRANAQASVEEPGVLRFDVLRDEADPARVVLVEVYRDEAGAVAHKETEHYATWRDTVAGMMARPRAATRYSVVFPTEPDRWLTPPA